MGETRVSGRSMSDVMSAKPSDSDEVPDNPIASMSNNAEELFMDVYEILPDRTFNHLFYFLPKEVAETYRADRAAHGTPAAIALALPKSVAYTLSNTVVGVSRDVGEVFFRGAWFFKDFGDLITDTTRAIGQISPDKPPTP
jgi:hypothetical protein